MKTCSTLLVVLLMIMLVVCGCGKTPEEVSGEDLADVPLYPDSIRIYVDMTDENEMNVIYAVEEVEPYEVARFLYVRLQSYSYGWDEASAYKTTLVEKGKSVTGYQVSANKVGSTVTINCYPSNQYSGYTEISVTLKGNN